MASSYGCQQPDFPDLTTGTLTAANISHGYMEMTTPESSSRTLNGENLTPEQPRKSYNKTDIICPLHLMTYFRKQSPEHRHLLRVMREAHTVHKFVNRFDKLRFAAALDQVLYEIPALKCVRTEVIKLLSISWRKRKYEQRTDEENGFKHLYDDACPMAASIIRCFDEASQSRGSTYKRAPTSYEVCESITNRNSTQRCATPFGDMGCVEYRNSPCTATASSKPMSNVNSRNLARLTSAEETPSLNSRTATPLPHYFNETDSAEDSDNTECHLADECPDFQVGEVIILIHDGKEVGRANFFSDDVDEAEAYDGECCEVFLQAKLDNKDFMTLEGPWREINLSRSECNKIRVWPLRDIRKARYRKTY